MVGRGIQYMEKCQLVPRLQPELPCRCLYRVYNGTYKIYKYTHRIDVRYMYLHLLDVDG